MSRHIQAPPSSITGPLGAWLQQLWKHIEAQPSISLQSFSGASTPDSLVTGLPGDICINIGADSSTSRVFVLGGAARSVLTQLGWARVRVLE